MPAFIPFGGLIRDVQLNDDPSRKGSTVEDVVG
jgi:hypothetical protein